MPCALTQGYVLDCKDSLGGITEVYFMAAQDVSTTTEASGVITAITKKAGKKSAISKSRPIIKGSENSSSSEMFFVFKNLSAHYW